MSMASYISEIKLKQSLRRVTIISLCSLILLLMFGFATYRIVNYVYSVTLQSELQATVNKYAINIKRKAQGDLKALRTLATFTKDADDIVGTYSKITKDSVPFEIVGFWYLDGSCQQVSLSGRKTDSSYKNLPPQVKLAVSSAWLGHTTVSSPYFSPTIGKDMITYVTPVYDRNGNVTAALSGAVGQDSFEDALNQLSVLNKGVDTFLTTSSGFIFSTGVNKVLPNDLDNITKFVGMSDESLDQIRVGLVSTNAASIETELNNHSYLITLTPLGFSDWYLGTISDNEFTSAPHFKSLLALIIILVVIFFVCAFIAVYLFLSMKSSYKTQLLIAHFDPITKAYNYSKFLLEFDQLDYRNDSEPAYAVATLNIHDFSYITDMIGEPQADEVLRTIARIVKEHPNVVMFCHHESDQFYLLLNLNTPQTVDPVIRSIMDMCVTEINANISSIPIVMYSGVAFTYNDLSPDRIVARAEFAKKQIIKSYTHAVRFYDENSYKKEAFLHNIEKSMRNALINQEFKLFLQPKIDLKTGKISAAEALVRWISDSDSVVYPNDFIPLFEKNGFCTELDLYMFDKVCAKIRYYLDNNVTPIYFSINQTKLLIFQKGYTDQLRKILAKYRIPPKYIVIEVLEDLATHNVNELNQRINELKSLGLSIALDDFGSGYSSLNIVAGLDIDEIKFDREFLMVEEEEQIKKNHMILRVLSKLAKELGIRTVVEGVERHDDVEFLKTIDCDLAQGYYYDRPIPAEAFDRKYMFEGGILPGEKEDEKEAHNDETSKSDSSPTHQESDAAAQAAKASDSAQDKAELQESESSSEHYNDNDDAAATAEALQAQSNQQNK